MLMHFVVKSLTSALKLPCFDKYILLNWYCVHLIYKQDQMCFPSGNSAKYVYIGVGMGLLSKFFGFETMTAVEYGFVAAGIKYIYDKYSFMEPGPTFSSANQDNDRSCECG